MTDSELLARFVRQSDEAAFAALVQRHLDLVYAAALRHVTGDSHRAEDITQQVFIDLARKAPNLTRHACLTGWLYASTRFAALNALRRERRRASCEERAELMPEPSPASPARWEDVRGVIDDAIAELDERDRQSIVLRFFGEQSFAAIGRQLGMSENAVQKRVNRALERLNVTLLRRGIASTAGALSVTLAQSAVAAPAALAGAVTKAAVAGVGAAAGWLGFLSVAKLVTGVGASLAVGAATGFMFHARVAERAAMEREAEFSARVQRAEKRLQAESARAASAETDVANLLSAISRTAKANAHAAATPPFQPRTTAAPAATPLQPSPAGPDEYAVRAGDTAMKLAAASGLTIEQLLKLNPDTNWARLRVGQTVRLRE